MRPTTTNKESYAIKLIKTGKDEWIAELYKDDKLIKTSEKTLYNGAVAIASQFLLRAPYAELV